jgi:NADH-quinone oxidoreductase subunit E
MESRHFQRVSEILDSFGNDPVKLIAILQSVQNEYRYLPEPVLSHIATSLNMSRARVFGVATFYDHFSLQPKGKYVIKICDGAPCHVNRSQSLLDLIERRFKLNDKKPITDDMLFTLERVPCLSACGLAPVVVINDRVHGQMDTAKLGVVLDKILEAEQGKVE